MFVCLINLYLLFPSIVVSELVCARRRPDAHAPVSKSIRSIFSRQAVAADHCEVCVFVFLFMVDMSELTLIVNVAIIPLSCWTLL